MVGKYVGFQFTAMRRLSDKKPFSLPSVDLSLPLLREAWASILHSRRPVENADIRVEALHQPFTVLLQAFRAPQSGFGVDRVDLHRKGRDLRIQGVPFLLEADPRFPFKLPRVLHALN